MLLLLKFKWRREEEATVKIFRGSSPTNWLSERSRDWMWGRRKTESGITPVRFLPARSTETTVALSPVHVMPFQWQTETERSQLERRRDGSV